MYKKSYLADISISKSIPLIILNMRLIIGVKINPGKNPPTPYNIGNSKIKSQLKNIKT